MNRMKKPFLETFKEKVQKAYPSSRIKEGKEKEIEIEINGTTHNIHTANLEREYNNHPTGDVFENFFKVLEVQVKGIDIASSHHKEKLVPIIRPYKEGEVEYLRTPLNQYLEIRYAVEFEGSIRYVTENDLHDLFSYEDLYLSTLENVMKKGWMQHQKEIQEANGKILIFENDEDEYMGQFLIPSMVKEFLGDNFFISFPTQHQTFVLLPNYTKGEDWLEALLSLKHVTMVLEAKENRPLSNRVLRMQNGELIGIG